MRDLKLKHLAIALSFTLIACQDNDIKIKEESDPNMELALARADEFLNSSRTESTDSDVTVIKYNDELLYKTNTFYWGYQPIGEMTITAITHPGGYVFWHSGGGVKRLIDIDFDEDSEELLGDERPFEEIDDHMWVLFIPWDFDVDNFDLLKYDIVYEDNYGNIVRLDPKIQVKSIE